MAIITLTSIPPRFELIGPTLETLLAQRGIAAVELSLPYHYTRFPDWDGTLPAIVEWQDHPWFIGVQFHPELKSKPFEPHPLFTSFIAAAMEQSRLV